MVIDAFEIYGHDPTDKLDHLAHYQIQMMKIKHAPDQYIINELVHIATDHLARFIHMHVKELKVLLIALDDAIDNMLTMYDNHNAIKTERVATYNTMAGGAVPAEFYMSQGPFIIPGDPGTGLSPVPPFIEQTTETFNMMTTDTPDESTANITYTLDGCWYMFPPNYGSIAGISYLDPLTVNEYRFTCQGSGNKGLYWYPQWMGAPPHHPYPRSGDGSANLGQPVDPIFYPHQQGQSPPVLMPNRK
ncbi:unnamed protein product [Arctia plantaginis]|uniref:Uncharacterized protein n=1 Tax=Arctia plantaginis TaxID=874455 RepID=A0A8S1ARK8_ARCPL|nr:unnamed protein product [Arctia plantaginis]